MVARQRLRLSESVHGLDRFALRMALVELTGSVAAWANGLGQGLLKWDQESAAADFAAGPPFASTDLTPADYDQLEDYLESRIDLLRELLARDRSDPT
jgi:hypothetical protein